VVDVSLKKSGAAGSVFVDRLQRLFAHRLFD